MMHPVSPDRTTNGWDLQAVPTSKPEALPPAFSWRNGRLLWCSRPLWSADIPDEDWRTALQRNGFRPNPMFRLGADWDPVTFDVYGRLDEQCRVPHFLGNMTLAGGDSYIVWLDDPADFLDIFQHLTPAIAAAAALDDREEHVEEEERARSDKHKARRDIWG